MSTHILPQSDVQSIALVGKIVTRGNRQFKVHSVEGRDWYAFDQDGTTTLDLGFAPLANMIDPVLTLLPMGAKVGDGLSVNEYADRVTRGVCLEKSWI